MSDNRRIEPYTKPPQTFTQQAEIQILKRGLEEISIDGLAKEFSRINYYRFTGYLYHRRKKNSNEGAYKKGTSYLYFKKIYDFDEELRLLLLQKIGQFEISLKTQLVNFVTLKENDQFFYKNPSILEGLSKDENKWKKYQEKLEKQIRNAQTFSIELANFFKKYTQEPGLPAWAVCEILTFGQISQIFCGLKINIQNDFVAKLYPEINKEIFRSWLTTISSLRNMCAHHNQIIGRSLENWKHKRPDGQNPIQQFFSQYKRLTTYTSFAILEYFLKPFNSDKQFKNEHKNLLEKHQIKPIFLGMHKNWEEDIIWN